MRISDWSSDVCSSDLRFGVGGELKLQQLLPHLLLAAAQVDDIAGKGVRPRQEQAAKAQQAVDCRGGAGAAADQVAEIDQAVAGLEAREHRPVQTVESRHPRSEQRRVGEEGVST